MLIAEVGSKSIARGPPRYGDSVMGGSSGRKKRPGKKQIAWRSFLGGSR